VTRVWEGGKCETYTVSKFCSGKSRIGTRRKADSCPKQFDLALDAASSKLWWGVPVKHSCDAGVVDEGASDCTLQWYKPGSRRPTFAWCAKLDPQVAQDSATTWHSLDEVEASLAAVHLEEVEASPGAPWLPSDKELPPLAGPDSRGVEELPPPAGPGTEACAEAPGGRGVVDGAARPRRGRNKMTARLGPAAAEAAAMSGELLRALRAGDGREPPAEEGAPPAEVSRGAEAEPAGGVPRGFRPPPGLEPPPGPAPPLAPRRRPPGRGCPAAVGAPPQPPPLPGQPRAEVEAEAEAGEFSITLDRSCGTAYGGRMAFAGADAAALQIDRIDTQGLFHLWNAGNPERAIRPGDRVIEVNGCRGHASVLTAQLKQARVHSIVVRRSLEAPAAEAAGGPPAPRAHAGGGAAQADGHRHRAGGGGSAGVSLVPAGAGARAADEAPRPGPLEGGWRDRCGKVCAITGTTLRWTHPTAGATATRVELMGVTVRMVFLGRVQCGVLQGDQICWSKSDIWWKDRPCV
ncbi:unnamed protein product, partial [Prorocentrum cordatum]